MLESNLLSCGVPRLGSRGGVEDWKGDEHKMPQSRPHPGSPHPLSLGPRLFRLCRNRRKALAKDGWEGRLDAFRLSVSKPLAPSPAGRAPSRKAPVSPASSMELGAALGPFQGRLDLLSRPQGAQLRATTDCGDGSTH